MRANFIYVKIFVIIISIIALLALIIVGFIKLHPVFSAMPDFKGNSRISKSPNFEDGKFVNVEPTVVMSDEEGSMISTMLEWFRGVENGKPDSVSTVSFDVRSFLENSDNGFNFTWLGHSGVLLRMGERTIVIDPVLSKYASPVPFTNVAFNFTNPIEITDIPDIDVMIISHDHYDHLDMNTIKGLNNRVAKYLVPLGVKSHLTRWGVDPNKVHEFDWWDSMEMDSINFICTPARHFSGRGLSRNNTLWSSWVIDNGSNKVFFGGDSGYGKHFSTIGEKYGPFDLTFIECGQYNKKWPSIHAMPEESVQAHIDLRGEVMVPIHWSKFQLALHSWTEPVDRATKAANELDVTLMIPVIGDVVVVK